MYFYYVHVSSTLTLVLKNNITSISPILQCIFSCLLFMQLFPILESLCINISFDPLQSALFPLITSV